MIKRGDYIGLSRLHSSAAQKQSTQKEFAMKPYQAFLFGMLVMLLASSLFWAGTAYARTGCFLDTNGHWAEQFICWLKDNGIAGGYPDGKFHPDRSVTRAEMAVMLQRANSMPPSSGAININASPGDWIWEGTPGRIDDSLGMQLGKFKPNTYLRLWTGHPGDHEFVMTPTFPSALYGRRLKLSAIDYCVVGGEDAYIDYIFMTHYSPGWDEDGVSEYVLDDRTDIKGKTCLSYHFVPPVELDHRSVLSVQVGLTWTVNSDIYDEINLGGVTFYLMPTEDGWD
jgi:hypothetical protein